MNEQQMNNDTPAGLPEPVQTQAADPTGPAPSNAPAVNQEPAAEQQPLVAEQQPPDTEQQPPDTEQQPPDTEQQPPDTEQQPLEAEQQPLETEQQPPGPAPAQQEQKPAISKSPKNAPARRRRSVSRQDPARVADYFAGCPRCSFFLAGYRLVCQDFDEAAAGAVDDWLDLSWNLAVRNLVGKSYGHALSEPFEAFQGVCPECMRAFTVEPGPDDEESHRFSIQINPRS